MKRFRNFFLLGLLLTGFLSFPARAEETAGSGSGFGVSLGPSIVRLTGAPGQSQSSKVKVWNKSPHAMKFTLEVQDIGNRMDATGRLDRIFSPPGTLPDSCAKWILLQEKEFEIASGDSREVELIVSSPADASGGKAAVVFFSGMPGTPPSGTGQSEKPAASVQIVPRLGVLVFFETQGTINRSGKISDFTVEPPGQSGSLVIQYHFENVGNTDILLSGNFYVLDQNKALVAKDNLEAMRTFPGDKGVGKTEWQGLLSPGEYHLVATFELGPDTEEVIVKELDFTIPPAAE